MKKIFVYVFFILIPPVGSALVSDSSISSKSGSFVLEANITDLYSWSEDLSKYSLEESRFSFKIWNMGVPSNGKSDGDKTARLMPISPGDPEPGSNKTARLMPISPGDPEPGSNKTARLMPVSPDDPEPGSNKTARLMPISPGDPEPPAFPSNLHTVSLVDEGRVTQKSGSSSARYLSVSHNKVSIESASSGKVSVKSRLSQKKDTLDIYLPEGSKKQMWVRLLKVAGVSPVFSEDGHLNYSDYNCKLNKAQQLVCSIKYLSRSL